MSRSVLSYLCKRDVEASSAEISKMSRNVFYTILVAALSVAAPFARAQDIGWKDSYSIDGKCYCETSFDHNIADVIVDGPHGPITVREACALAGSGPEGPRIYYNDVQCGNGPANDAPDETDCPGRVDMGDGNREGCMIKGPKWAFAQAAAAATVVVPPPPPPPAVDPSRPVMTGLLVVNIADGSQVRLGDTISASGYPSGFNIRAEVPDAAPVERVEFYVSTGYTHVEYTSQFDMFPPGQSWGGPPTGTVICTVVAKKKDGNSEMIQVNINLAP